IACTVMLVMPAVVSLKYSPTVSVPATSVTCVTLVPHVPPVLKRKVELALDRSTTVLADTAAALPNESCAWIRTLLEQLPAERVLRLDHRAQRAGACGHRLLRGRERELRGRRRRHRLLLRAVQEARGDRGQRRHARARILEIDVHAAGARRHRRHVAARAARA